MLPSLTQLGWPHQRNHPRSHQELRGEIIRQSTSTIFNKCRLLFAIWVAMIYYWKERIHNVAKQLIQEHGMSNYRMLRRHIQCPKSYVNDQNLWNLCWLDSCHSHCLMYGTYLYEGAYSHWELCIVTEQSQGWLLRLSFTQFCHGRFDAKPSPLLYN